jgi:hypothetical protein
MIQTDGVGVSIIFQAEVHNNQGIINEEDTSEANIQRQFRLVSNIPPAELRVIGENSAYIDPGRRDLMYILHDQSQHQQGQRSVLRYTLRTSRHLRNLSGAIMYRLMAVAAAPQELQIPRRLQELSTAPLKTTHIDGVTLWLNRRRDHMSVLLVFYATYRLPQLGVGYPLFRKLRLSACFGTKREEIHIHNQIWTKFPEPETLNLIYGNWSSPMQRHHEPIKG